MKKQSKFCLITQHYFGFEEGDEIGIANYTEYDGRRCLNINIEKKDLVPCIPISVLAKKLGIVRRRVLEKYCPPQPQGNSVYRAGVDDFAEELKKELEELK